MATNDTGQGDAKSASAFEASSQRSRTTLFGELVGFLRDNKKWWLAPILVVMLLAGLLVVLAGTGAAPFIYTLF